MFVKSVQRRLLARVVKYNISNSSRPFFSRKHLQVTPVDRCSRAVAQKTWSHSRKCLLGVRTLKLISTFYIIAKTVQILAKTGLSFFSTERLTMELFKSKVPLIVYKSCIVNRQIGVGDSKFVVYFDPLLLQVQKIELLCDCKRTPSERK